MQMQTSTGGVQTYVRYGRFKFHVDGQPAELTIYQSSNGYFLPFVDSLAGTETYPAGRYLEPEPLPGERFLVDFNVAYNFFFQAEDGIRGKLVTGVQTCALPICRPLEDAAPGAPGASAPAAAPRRAAVGGDRTTPRGSPATRREARETPGSAS